MKSDIFYQYVDKITDLFRITREDLFSKTKRRDIADARNLLYYLCKSRPMTLVYIQRYMSENGYDIKHSSIIYGIKTVVSKVEDDDDYMRIVKEIEKSVFI
jgi:chromosomal replication initiation ATPase DnaA